ncbi:MAG: GtrA family protein [Bacteroidales bacterium]|jgi:putative flippase GtrA|nr:GtrA family protein [Bacteroidales bacterium]
MKLIKKFFKNKLIRFFLVAGLNTAFGVVVYASLIFIGLSYVWASLLGMIIGILFNFQTYGGLVFGNRNIRLIFRFIGVYAIMYVSNVSGIYLLKHFIFDISYFFTSLLQWLDNLSGNVITFEKAEDILAGIILCIPIGLLGFVLNKNLVFKKKQYDHEEISEFKK